MSCSPLWPADAIGELADVGASILSLNSDNNNDDDDDDDNDNDPTLTGLMMRLPVADCTVTRPCSEDTEVTGEESRYQDTDRLPGVPCAETIMVCNNDDSDTDVTLTSPSQMKLTMSPSVLFWLRGGLVITAPPIKICRYVDIV